MKYKIVTATSRRDLEIKVNDLLSEGWILLGGPTVADVAGVVSPDGQNALTYHQALTLGDEEVKQAMAESDSRIPGQKYFENKEKTYYGGGET